MYFTLRYEVDKLKRYIPPSTEQFLKQCKLLCPSLFHVVIGVGILSTTQGKTADFPTSVVNREGPL